MTTRTRYQILADMRRLALEYEQASRRASKEGLADLREHDRLHTLAMRVRDNQCVGSGGHTPDHVARQIDRMVATELLEAELHRLVYREIPTEYEDDDHD